MTQHLFLKVLLEGHLHSFILANASMKELESLQSFCYENPTFSRNNVRLFLFMMIKNKSLNIFILSLMLLLHPIAVFASLPKGADKIPDSIVSLSSGFIIVVDKKYQKLYVFNKTENFSKVFEATCSTGKIPGSKKVEGDEKTPSGIFFVTKKLINPGPPETFGSMAFPLDYPTISDKRAGKNGHNIWIHGTTKPLLPTQSKGCVVLHDTDLRRLGNFIYFNKTPVIISESINWVPQNYVSPAKNELQRILISWNKAFIGSDLKTIDSLYLKGAEMTGRRREDLNNKVKYSKNLGNHFALTPKDISILQTDNNAVIIFDQIYSVDNNSFQGFYNKLILEKINNKWYVIDDATTTPVISKNAAPVNNKQNETQSVSTEAVRNLVYKWAKSWEAGNMKSYRNCYASNFQSKGMNLNDWVTYKSDVRKNSTKISIRIENLQISADGNVARASFTQYYSSSLLNSKGRKTLEMKKIGNEWKIAREMM